MMGLTLDHVHLIGVHWRKENMFQSLLVSRVLIRFIRRPDNTTAET